MPLAGARPCLSFLHLGEQDVQLIVLYHVIAFVCLDSTAEVFCQERRIAFDSDSHSSDFDLDCQLWQRLSGLELLLHLLPELGSKDWRQLDVYAYVL